MMPEKPKSTKKKSPVTPARPTKTATPSPPPKSGARSKVAKAKLPERKPSAGDKLKREGEVRKRPSFAEARNAAIDELVVAIEAAELQLLSLKRATRYEELPTNGSSK